MADDNRAGALLMTRSQAYLARFLTTQDRNDLDHAITIAELIVGQGGPEEWKSLHTLANAYQELFTLTEDTRASDKGIESLSAARSKMPPGSPNIRDVTATLIGFLLERYDFDGDESILARASAFAADLAGEQSEFDQASGLIRGNVALARWLAAGSSDEERRWLAVIREIALGNGPFDARIDAVQNWIRLSFASGNWNEVLSAFAVARDLRAASLAENLGFAHRSRWLFHFRGLAALAAFAAACLGDAETAMRIVDHSQSLGYHKSGTTDGEPFGAPLPANIGACWYLVATWRGGAALVRTAGSASVVPLDGLTSSIAEHWRRSSAVDGEELARLVVEPITRTVGHADSVMLVPVGSLFAIPWSVAKLGDAYLFDRVVLHLTPTMRLLRPPLTNKPARSLLVHEPSAPGMHMLRHAAAEIGTARQLLPEAILFEAGQSSSNGVLGALADVELAHFACHAKSDPYNPLRSAIYLAEPEVLALGDINRLRASKLRLAILAACETALPIETLPEEVAALGVGFLAAGVSGVIGTLWKVDDRAASLCIRHFYRNWLSGQLSPAAAALHSAQLWLRDTTNQVKIEWLESLGPPSDPDEQTLRDWLAEDPGKLAFSSPRYWAAFVYLGL
jgi:CHAT domain-containing protein